MLSIHLWLLQFINSLKVNSKRNSRRLKSIGKHRSASTIQHNIDEFDPKKVKSIGLKRKHIECSLPKKNHCLKEKKIV